MINETDDIKVSVCVVTYNQEKYIAECLDSLVSQETDFKFEIIVGEDCSTDGTRAIVQQYVDKYPDIVKPIFHKNNVGAVENVKQVYIAAKGKYIAHMDGDDMALPTKLQKQFDVMERSPQAVICSHNVLEVLDNVFVERGFWKYQTGEYTILDLIKALPFFAHSSKLFRVIDNDNIYNILKDPDTLDIELHLYQASMGSIIHLEECLGCYRIDIGITTVKDNKLNYRVIKRVLSVYEKLLVEYPDFRKEVKKAYAFYLLDLANSYAVVESDGTSMRKYAFKALKYYPYSVKQIGMAILAIPPSIGVFLLKTRNKIKYKK